MKKLLIVVIVLLEAVLMTQTVPSKQEHKEAMMKAVEEYVEEEAENRGLSDNMLNKLGKNVVVKTIETALNTKLKVNNYYLLNTTHIRMKGKNQMLSLGVFGHVFTFDKKMLREKLEESLKAKEELQNEKQAAKESERELKKLQKEKRKRERELKKEERKRERELRREQKRHERELKKQQKNK